MTRVNELSIKLSDHFNLPRKGYVVEQGIPVLPTDRGEVRNLALLDEAGNIIPASIEHDGRDEGGRTIWVRVTAPMDLERGQTRRLKLISTTSAARPSERLELSRSERGFSVRTRFFTLNAESPGNLRLETAKGALIDGPVDFQLWPDARSIIGGGAGTCRLASFIAEGWSLEEETPTRCLMVLKGRVPKYAPYTSDPNDLDRNAQFDCELELIVTAFSPVIRFRWRIENYTVWQAYLERYAVRFPLAKGARIVDGEQSDDGKYLRWVQAEMPGGKLEMTAGFVDALGAGAGINAERRENLGSLPLSNVAAAAADGVFEPHRYLAADEDAGKGLDLVQGGINPPHDGCMWADNPEVHRLFYLGMGRTFDGALLVNCSREQAEAELHPIYFELEPDYYSRTGALPENGDPVDFGEFRDQVFAAAEWMLREQWQGTLWWGEWWREWDVYRRQGVESTANANNPLGPLYHYWRTGDARFVECAKRSMQFVYDVQLSKRRTGLGPFFQSRRFLIDKMEWVHMRYQRIEGPIKAAHFFGDRRLRMKILEAMRSFAEKLVCPNGAPGYGSGGPNGKRVPAGSDCTNFGEVLGILYRETGEERFLQMARKMANWTIRFMNTWDWDKDIGNSYGWHFLMRGMLSTIKLTGSRRFKDWYLEMARRNMTYDMSRIRFVHWMNWLIVEAEKMSGETWMLDVLKKNTTEALRNQGENGVVMDECEYPWSKWPSAWHRIYDPKCVVAYVPVLTARRKALGLE